MVSAPRSAHTGGKTEAQLTKKQAVLLMHNICVIGVLVVEALMIWGSLSNYTFDVVMVYMLNVIIYLVFSSQSDGPKPKTF